jgi:hypothetical protein
MELLQALASLWRQRNERRWIHTQGESMLPLIQENDRLLLNFDLTTVRRGSISLFSRNGKLVAHRVLRIIPGAPPHFASPRFLTKGDNSWSFDVQTGDATILGYVVAIQKPDALIVLDTPKWRWIGWFIAIATLSVALPYGWFRRIKQHLWGTRPVPGIQAARQFGSAIQLLLLSLLLRNERKQT